MTYATLINSTDNTLQIASTLYAAYRWASPKAIAAAQLIAWLARFSFAVVYAIVATVFILVKLWIDLQVVSALPAVAKPPAQLMPAASPIALLMPATEAPAEASVTTIEVASTAVVEAEPDRAEAEAEPVPMVTAQMSRNQLRAIAKRIELPRYSRMSKAELYEALSNLATPSN
ncbi:hypothetical protein [Nodosilinea nodulosa]|uniref:hypothetical protein n=1 Tax=Nodosilinea nodulosa TaxID=416001 RepID=UPI00031634AE|nr:hypothetical protein [Nodosilinea nodulosa]